MQLGLLLFSHQYLAMNLGWPLTLSHSDAPQIYPWIIPTLPIGAFLAVLIVRAAQQRSFVLLLLAFAYALGGGLVQTFLQLVLPSAYISRSTSIVETVVLVLISVLGLRALRPGWTVDERGR